MLDNEPIIKLQEGGVAAVINYNVPEATSYTGLNYIELKLDSTEYFKPEVFDQLNDANTHDSDTTPPSRNDLPQTTKEFIDQVKEDIGIQIGNPRTVPITVNIPRMDASPPPPANYKVQSATKTPGKVAEYADLLIRGLSSLLTGSSRKPNEASTSRLAGTDTSRTPTTSTSLGWMAVQNTAGNMVGKLLPVPTRVRPHLVLIESYRLSSYLGDYGAGRTIRTFSLLPGEKTKISIKSYTKTAAESDRASSIFDSFTDESSQEFENALEAEQSDKANSEEASSYYADARFHAKWGWGSVDVSGGVKGSSNSAREEFARKVSKAASKHAAKASSKRDIQINTNYSVKTEQGEETATEREIENINLSRTLNFVFRQMNQQFISLLHLVDIRVAYSNGLTGSNRVFRDVALPQLGSLLEEFIVADKHQEVKRIILDELNNIYDYKDERCSFAEEKTLEVFDNQNNLISTFEYPRARKGVTSVYQDPVHGMRINVPGIIMAADTYVLRTESVVVEALLGQAAALDTYSQGLQSSSVAAQEIKNQQALEAVAKARLARTIVEEKDDEATSIYTRLFANAVDHHHILGCSVAHSVGYKDPVLEVPILAKGGHDGQSNAHEG
jgi:hypothetical protein